MNDKQFIERRLAELLDLADAEVKKWQDACIEVQAERDALEADLARCRAANVYDGAAHKRVADLEAALREIVAAKTNCAHKGRPEYHAGITLGLAECAKIALTALETKADLPPLNVEGQLYD